VTSITRDEIDATLESHHIKGLGTRPPKHSKSETSPTKPVKAFKMFKFTSVLLSLVVVACAQQNTQDVTQAAPTAKINITDVQTTGPGCGRNQARLENGTILVGPLPAFDASFANQSKRQTSCLVMAQITYPIGTQFAVLPGTVHGTARLDPGVTARFMYSHHYQQEPQVSVS
jgi:hypothetical protein